jgi:maltose O-acetyltransferase
MFLNQFLFNQTRKNDVNKFHFFRSLIINFLLKLGFQNIDYGYVHGDKKNIIIKDGVSTMNTLFNVISGRITIGENTLFGHNCMVLTGTHSFINGKRASLNQPPLDEVPKSGRDINIGIGCFIGSGTIILGNSTIGNNVIIGAGSVVNSNIPNNCFAAGIPAKVIKYH